MKRFSNQHLFSEACLEANLLKQYLLKTGLVIRCEIAGSIRRKKEIVKDIDILATTNNPKKLMESFVEYKKTKDMIVKGDTKTSITLESGINADLRVVTVSYTHLTLPTT